MNIPKLRVLLAGHEMDDIDFVFLPGEEKSKLLMDCSDCSYCGYTVGDSIERHVGRYSNVYCSNAQRIIHDLDIPIKNFSQRRRRPHISIPGWRPLRSLLLTHVPLSTKDETFAQAIVYSIASLGRHGAIRPLSQGRILVLEGELTPDVKEILVEILI
jgi:hypothetical protein